MIVKHAQKGYILVLTLMMLTIVLVLTTQIFNGGTIYSLIAQTTVEREKAKRLALGGVQVAMSQLFTTTSEQPIEKPQLQKALVPALNRWQQFTFTQGRDGIEGALQICVMCEQGKFNLNAFYDFPKKKFINEDQPNGGMRKIAEELFKRVKDFVGGKDLFPAFEKLLKERGYPFNDVTELFASAEFAPFKNLVFYEPPSDQEKKGKRPVYLTDLFTVSTQKELIDPLLFSDSVCAVLGLARAQDGQIKKRTEEIKNLLQNMKPKIDWKADWDTILKPLYGKDFTSLPKDIDSVLDSQFEPLTFSVLSYGKVGKISQRMLVIIEKHTNKKGSSASPFIIKRMYWI
jgi:hypothetical protein